jgi:hypothetical protein
MTDIVDALGRLNEFSGVPMQHMLSVSQSEKCQVDCGSSCLPESQFVTSFVISFSRLSSKVFQCRRDTRYQRVNQESVKWVTIPFSPSHSQVVKFNISFPTPLPPVLISTRPYRPPQVATVCEKLPRNKETRSRWHLKQPISASRHNPRPDLAAYWAGLGPPGPNTGIVCAKKG